MKRLRTVFLFLLTISAISGAYAQRTPVYRAYPVGTFEAEASSTAKGSSARAAVDGSGMRGRMHEANNLGQGMWVSDVAKSPVRYCSSTHEGAVWLLCRAAEPLRIDRIQIWNHNQNEHTRRGFKRVHIEWSLDGREWHLLSDGRLDCHVIPESVGRNPEPADFTLDTPGLKARYICFTAAAGGEGNHYDRLDSIAMREAADMHQNPDYYGLSEIRFYRKESASVASLGRLEGLSFAASQGYLRTAEGPAREFYLTFDTPLYAGATIDFALGGKSWRTEIAPSAGGVDRYEGRFPAGYMEEASELRLTLKSPQGDLQRRFEVPAARRWTVCFLPHSHQDIGYTHRQNDVMKLQWRNLERALELADRTKAYPDGARYRWNTEATWAVAAYLDHYAGTEKAERLIRAVREGVVNIDASLGSILTGICRQEELMHLFDDAHRIEKLTGVELNTAMMSDVPGQVWGLATALAQNGVRYFSPGPNYVPFYGRIGNDRAAALHVKWGDRPFWWQSQSGTDKVLVWQAGRGYSWFHGWLAGSLSVCGLEPVWNYLQELETGEFPYDVCYLRYTVHGDNGPPDERMPDVIRAWNERYASPQFRIATAREFFTDFEARYGDRLPAYAGDMTPTWEDGAASTARETAMNRESAARLVQAGILWTMLSPEAAYPAGEFAQAWRNTALFSEHTWGASASGPDPHSQFTKELWAGKKMYADSADMQSRRLYDRALAPLTEGGGCVQVLNTNLWPRTDIVTVDADLTGKRLTTLAGEPVAVQRLHDGRWAFVAEKVPALSSAVYRIVPARRSRKASEANPPSMIDGCVLDNGLVRVAVDPAKGTLRSLKAAGADYEYAAGEGLNDYLYTGRMAADPRGIDRVTGVEVLDDGPVAATLRVVSDAPGCDRLVRDITLYRGIDRVDIRNTVDKQDILEHESVRFVFPFGFAHPEITMDLAMSEMHPEREQLAGVNKHYYSLLNGLTVGDLEHAVCLTSIDAPFVELGTPSGEDYRRNPRHGYGWWPSAQLSPTVYSWVMNNTWRTNYKASQGGRAVFRYSLQICDPFDPKLKQRGAEREQPLVALASGSAAPVEPLFRLTGRHRIAVSGLALSADGRGYVVRLQNMGGQSVRSAFEPGRLPIRSVSLCDWREEPIRTFDDRSFWMKPYEYLVLKLETE